MWTEPYNPLYVWGSCFHQLRTLFIPGGASVQQGLSAAFEAVRLGWHRGAADKRYSLAFIERFATMNIGEELVSAYLQQILGCDFTQQNLYTIDSQGEIDVVGLNLKDRSVYICEVAIHLTTGLQYTHAKRPNNVKKLTEKFSRDIAYTRKYLPDFKAHYMLWSPVVKSRKNESEYDQMKHLEQVHKNIQEAYSEDLQLIVNLEFSKRLAQLREKACKVTADLKSPVMRMLQIEGQLAKYAAKNDG